MSTNGDITPLTLSFAQTRNALCVNDACVVQDRRFQVNIGVREGIMTIAPIGARGL